MIRVRANEATLGDLAEVQNVDGAILTARAVGLDRVPLLCNRELDVPGAMERVIRVLAHYYADPGHTPSHVYIGETRRLRVDLHSAQ